MRWPCCAGQPGARAGRQKLKALLASKLDTARAWELKEPFGTSGLQIRHLGWRLSGLLVQRALRSRLEPMKKVARMLRTHEDC